MLTYIPGNSVWWATYGFTKAQIHSIVNSIQGEEHPLSRRQEVAIQLMSTVTSSMMSVSVTQPMDIVKTQMQTGILDPSTRHSIVSVLRRLVREEGLAGITKGWMARFLSSAPAAVSPRRGAFVLRDPPLTPLSPDPC